MNVEFEAARAASKTEILRIVKYDEAIKREIINFGKHIFQDSDFFYSLERGFLARERLRREGSRLEGGGRVLHA